MAISFKCGGCAKQYAVKDDLAGKRAKCKNCGQVMQIPNLAAAHEPDLHADTRDPSGGGGNASAETVAGSLISTPLETVADRSLSGRSVAGRSAAGHSVAGRSAAGQPAYQPPVEPYTPPPEPDYGTPPLSSLHHVQQSEGEAFDVHGGTDQELRQERGPASRNRAPGEPYSFLLIALMLAALGYSAYIYANTMPVPPGVPAEAIAKAGKPVLAGVMSRAATFLVALALIAPLVMGAWFAALKIANIRTPSGFYIRSLGLAALPVIALTLSDTLPAMADLAAVVGLACIPVGYALLQFVHIQTPMVAGITAGIATLAATIGLLAAGSASDTVETALRTGYDKKVELIAADVKTQRIRDAETKRNNDLKKKQEETATAVDDKADADAKSLQDKVDAFKAGLSNKQQTREKLAMTADALIAAVAAAKDKYADRPAWATMTTDLQAAKKQAEAFPSSTPPMDLADAPAVGADWSTKTGRREVSVYGFNVTPPLEGLIDLDPPAGAMQWTIGDSHTKLTIESATGTLPNQQRPWVAPAFVVAASNNAAVAIAADGQPRVEYGAINGLPAAKVSVDAANAADTRIVYAVHQGDAWLRCTIAPAAVGDPAVQAAQQSVRSLRGRTAGEPTLDPMPAADLIARFQSDPTVADRIVPMLKNKPNAEDALIKAMGFAPEESTVQKFGPLLVATATEKSSASLWKLAGADTQLADAARERLRALEPKTADDLAFALLDVKAGGVGQVKKGLAVLAFTDADAARQPSVSKALQSAIDSGAVFNGFTTDSQEAVLTKWFDESIGKKLQTVLENGSSPPASRKVAIRVLGATGNKKYVYPITRWVLEDPSTVEQTLIAMGPVAEADVGKLLNEKEPAARKAALTILDEIATARSFAALQACATRWADPETRDHAKAVIAKVRDKQAKPPQSK